MLGNLHGNLRFLDIGARMKRFTDASVKKLEVRDKPYEVLESDGFYVRVQPTGTKTFYYVYYETVTEGGEKKKKRKPVRIGSFPSMSVKQARDTCVELRKKRDSREAVAVDVTFEMASVEYMAAMKKHGRNVGTTIDNKQGYLDRVFNPAFGAMLIGDVRRVDIIDSLELYVINDQVSSYNAALTVVKGVFDHAIDREYIEQTPAYKITPYSVGEGERILSVGEMAAVMSTSHCRSAKILQVTLLTGARPGEVARMRYEDIVDGIWHCVQRKGRAAKVARRDRDEVRVRQTYLVPTVLDIIGAGKRGRVFPGSDTLQGVNLYVREKYRKTDQRNPWVPRDLRRTFGTRMAEDIGVDEKIIHMILGHKRDKLKRTYIRTNYPADVKDALLMWEAYLLEL